MSPENPELQLAHDFVQYTGSHIFLTGKAGTGKTTFLHNLQKQTAKRMIITAPTGVAAINAGGVTLHSFFQLPFGPHIPGSDAYDRNSQRQFRFSKEKKQIIQSLDLLVIDEISMVRADLLDAVDAVLRRHRRSNQAFGGVQLLMIGDLHQLSPVAKQEEWSLLQQYYNSVYFFSSRALAQTELLTIELKHIYRQSDEEFIRLLNCVRGNRLDKGTLADLNERYIPDFIPREDEGYITLTTHNASAAAINQERLQRLDSREYRFTAAVSGEFPEHIFPTSAKLILKEGAQVMFVRNDPSADKLYFNGKIGKIARIVGKTIVVSCPGENQEIEVEPVSWENIKYTINEENKEIAEEIVGKFEQYPLKLAWAITIHKSQGLTFERAIIDAQAAFAHGQVYVALSRCKTLEGMVLSSPLSSTGVESDQAVLGFDEEGRKRPPSERILWDAKVSYQQKLLFECFDFTLLRKHLGYLTHLLRQNARVVQLLEAGDLEQMELQAREQIFAVSENFRNELSSIFSTPSTLPETDTHTLGRISKASGWFQAKFAEIFPESLQNLNFDTDNKELRKKINNVLNNCKKEIAVKLAGIESCADGFSPFGYLHALSSAEIDFQPAKVKKKQVPAYGKADIDHPELFETLRAWRTAKAKEQDIAHFQVLYQRVLIQIAVCLPNSTGELLKIPGVGKKTVEKYGKDIVDLVCEYRQKHGIEAVLLVEPKVIPNEESSFPETGSRDISLEMFEKGNPIALIAKERGLVESTIEGHLRYFVEQGTLRIDRLISVEKQQLISKELSSQKDNSLSAVKTRLGEKVSYGDIKMMLAWQNSLDSK
ncbi:MAG: helix-turn-helix domain-containing protein [Desulfocapsa sp.]|nr:helix-turn-helix domain-containing protein [Desulfocapsa sp.]